MEGVLHIVMAAKGLVFLIREAETDFKAGQTGLLCFSYLCLKHIRVSYRSNYLVNPTPNQPGSISPDKLQNFIIYFNFHHQVTLAIKYVKLQAG